MMFLNLHVQYIAITPSAESLGFFVKSIVASILSYLYNQYACTVLVNVPYSWVSLQSFLSITLA